MALIGIAAKLPDSYVAIKTLLTAAAPFTSVYLAPVIDIVTNEITAGFKRWRMDRRVAIATRKRDEVYADPLSSEAEKREAHDAVEMFRNLSRRLLVAEIRDIEGQGPRIAAKPAGSAAADAQDPLPAHEAPGPKLSLEPEDEQQGEETGPHSKRSGAKRNKGLGGIP